jgi:hypothetical protein
MFNVVAMAKPALEVVAVVITWVLPEKFMGGSRRGLSRQDESLEDQEQDKSKYNSKTRASQEQPAERKVASMYPVSMAPIETWPSLSLRNDYLRFAACSLSLLLHFDECEFINARPSSFVLRLHLPYLPAGSGFLIRSCQKLTQQYLST